MKPSPELTALLEKGHVIGLVSAAIAGLLSLFGYVQFREAFYPAYLTAYLYWLSLTLGCLGIAMIHGMTGGAWGRMIRRVLEAGYETLPLMTLLFLPLLLSVTSIYEWSDPDFVAQHASVSKKAGYLNVTGYQWRAAIYFVVWLLISTALNQSSPNSDKDAESPRSLHLQKVSGLGFMAYGFTFTLAAVDWVMSLEPEWFSTMYGLIHIAGQGVSALSFAVLVVCQLRPFKPWSRTVTAIRLNDIGNLMLASVMFWAYCSFFQYLVIWSGNLPEENFWYVHRSQGGWQYLAMLLMLLHFAVPFLLLLPRWLKRSPARLSRVAGLLLAMHYLDLFWIITPGFQHGPDSTETITFLWLHLTSFVAIGGLWLAVFTWRLSVRIRIPLYDPELMERNHEPLVQSATT